METTPNEPSEELRAEVERHQWYHTFELAPGIETPGWFDLRGLVERIPFPASLKGKRCLDIGTFDGFWAFEMERRGAEVVAIDILDPHAWDWPRGVDPATVQALDRRKRGGGGFEFVAERLDSKVERRELSIHDLDPAAHGHFDLVYLGSLLLHLRDPVGALMAVREVCRETLIVCDAIDALASLPGMRRPLASLDGRGRPWWWRPNVAGLERMVEAAGFERVGATQKLLMTPGRGRPRAPLRPGVLASAAGRRELAESRRGDPHAVIEARPV